MAPAKWFGRSKSKSRPPPSEETSTSSAKALLDRIETTLQISDELERGRSNVRKVPVIASTGTRALQTTVVLPSKPIIHRSAGPSSSSVLAGLAQRWKTTKGVKHSRLLSTNGRGTYDVFRFPLPDDVDPDFSIPLKLANAQTGPGIQLSLAEGIADKFNTPNEHLVHCMEGAHKVLDTCIPTGEIVYHPGLLTADPAAARSKVTRKKPSEGFTLGHLATHVFREQYRYYQTLSKMAADDSPEIQRQNEIPPYNVLFVVAIRRAGGGKTQVRWIPEIEARVLQR